ncbi:MAG TPA: hypothetical protein VK762_22805 [Polyangiaceae bacterium]|jgi:hypothetical protein|nr:hypothetical protein [Polyangiaceae bacterium]
MRHALGLLGSALLGLCGVTALASNAHAQESYFRNTVPAPSRAVELQLSAGYTQGFGNIFPNHSISDVAGAGVGITAALGYRYTPRISFEAEGQYQAYGSENFGTSQGVDVNVGVTFHGAPYHRGDPWLRLATGWRWVWLSNAIPGPFVTGVFTDNVGFTGWDVINARIGYDIRSSGGVAWAPFIGANLQTFIWANSTALSTVQWGTYLYAGLQARFDAGGSRTNVASARSGFSAE